MVCLTGTTFTLAAQLQWLDYRHRARHRVTRFSGVVHLNLICISDSTRSDAISPLQRLCFIWPFYWRAIPSPAPMVSRTHESVDLQLGLATHTHTARSTRRYLGLCFDDGHCHDCGGSVSAACFPKTEGCLHLGGVCFASTQKLLISFQLLLPSTVLFYLENAIFCSLSAIISVVTERRRFQLARVAAAVPYYSICSKLCFV